MIQENNQLNVNEGSENDVEALNSIFEIRGSYFEMQNTYKAAMRAVTAKLEVLDDEFSLKHKRSPIHYMQSRLKEAKSIYEKLRRKRLEMSVLAVKENITDIAGVRVICYYIEDIYLIANLLKEQSDITFVREADYILNPKPNGYRSFHLIVKVPVFFSDKTEYVPVEIQIRTIGMDYWASIEHHLQYKAMPKYKQTVCNELRLCASIISNIDYKMQGIYKLIET